MDIFHSDFKQNWVFIF